jgi:hypothetical protein
MAVSCAPIEIVWEPLGILLISTAKGGLVLAFSRAKTSRQDSRLADMHVGPTW